MKIEAYCNTPDEKLLENVSINSKRPLKWIVREEPNDLHAVIVGGAPSVSQWLDEIRIRQESGQIIFALNGAAKFLRENGIIADYCVVIDARNFNTGFLNYAKTDLLASQCHPSMFELSKTPVLWHQEYPDLLDKFDACLPEDAPAHALIGGGTTVGLSAMALVYALGYRFMHLYGYDSSYREGSLHAYPQDDPQRLICEATAFGKTFQTTIAMAKQADLFPALSNRLIDLGCEITIRGDGLLPWVSEQTALQKHSLTAVYDLACSPPTYDFMSFLSEAEKYRIENGFDGMDVVFQPGPKDGFRDDDLPPSLEHRQSMLHRICVSSCRLVSSVRNIEVLKQRKQIEGCVFPEGWAIDNPVSHYGTRYFKNSPPVFKPSKVAKEQIKRDFGERYITITLRNTDYWPARNSNMDAWNEVKEWLRSEGYQVVIVPDTNSKMVGYAPAAWDIDLRCALYEGAIVNLFVTNGPAALCICMDAKHIIFKPICEGSNATTREFLFAHGLDIGDNFNDRGTLVWEDDDAETIIRETRNFLQTQLLEEENA